MNTKKITRFEIIDHTPCDVCGAKGFVEKHKPNIGKDGDEVVGKEECPACNGIGCPGRTVVFWDKDKQLDIDIQDDDRTLKVFIHPRYEE